MVAKSHASDTSPGRLDQAYDEETFRYFLNLEQTRAGRAGRSCLLVLVDLQTQAGSRAAIDSWLAAKLFRGLTLSLRETDFIGWYRHGVVAGAVLTQHADVDAEASRVVGDRVHRAVRQRLPSDVAARLQIRVYQLPADSASGIGVG
jgi:hypothetical protein